MTNKTISDLESVLTLADEDLIPVWQGTTTRKTTVGSVRTALTTSLPFSAITGAPDDNVALKAQFDAIEADIDALQAQVQFKLLAHGAANVSAPTTGSFVVTIPFPAGYNGTTAMCFVSGAYMQSATNSTGMRTINLNVSTGTTGWNVNASCINEDGSSRAIKFTYMVFTTGGVAPVNYTVTPVDSSPPTDPDPGDPPEIPVDPV